MAKKITIELWVEPLTKNGNHSIFLDNINEFVAHISKNGVPDLGEQDFDLEIIDADARRDA